MPHGRAGTLLRTEREEEEEHALRQAESDRILRRVRRQMAREAEVERLLVDRNPPFPREDRTFQARPAANVQALGDEATLAAGLRITRPGALFASMVPTVQSTRNERLIDQVTTPEERLAGESFASRAGRFAKGAGIEFLRSFNPLEADISGRERLFRTANIGSLFIPVGLMAQSTRLLRAFPAMRAAIGVTGATKGKIAIGAIETAAISGGLEAIRDPDERGEHGILTQMVLGGILGGAIGGVAISGAKAARVARGSRTMARFNSSKVLGDMKNPFHDEEFAIISAQSLHAPDRANVRVQQTFMDRLEDNGFVIKEVKMSDGRMGALIADITEDSAIQLAADMGQVEIMTKNGLLDLLEGTAAPMKPTGMRVGIGIDAAKDRWMQIVTDEGVVTLSLGLDMANLVQLTHPAVMFREGGTTALDALLKHRPTTRGGRVVSFWDHLKGVDSRTVLSDWYDGIIRGTYGGAHKIDELIRGNTPLMFHESIADVMHAARTWAGKLKNSLERGVFAADDPIRGSTPGEMLEIIGPPLQEAQAKVVGSAEKFQTYGIAKHFMEVAERRLVELGWDIPLQDLVDLVKRGGLMPVRIGDPTSFKTKVEVPFTAREPTGVREIEITTKPTDRAQSAQSIMDEVEKVLPGSGLTEEAMRVSDILEWDMIGKTATGTTGESWEEILRQHLDWRFLQKRESLVKGRVISATEFNAHYGEDAATGATRSRNVWEVPLQESDATVRPYGLARDSFQQLDEVGTDAFAIFRKKRASFEGRQVLFEPWWDQMVIEQAAFFRMSAQQRATSLLISRGRESPEFLARFLTKVDDVGQVTRAESILPFQTLNKKRVVRDLVDAPGPSDLQAEQLLLEGPTSGTPTQVSEFWQINDDVLWRDIERMGPMGQHMVASLFGLPAQILRTSATSSFEFLTKNPIRDLTFAFVNAGVNPIAFVQGIGHLLKPMRINGRLTQGSDLVRAWLEAGGARAALASQNRRDVAAMVRSVEAGKIPALKNVMAHPLEAFFKVSELLENATRVGAFNQRFNKLIQEGVMTPSQAAEAAAKFSREASVDFGMAGSYAWMSNFRILTAFFNATLQGTDQIVRSVKRDPHGTLVRMFAAITVPSVALYMINRKDPAYRELPPWERMMFWHIKRSSLGPVGTLLGEDEGPEDDLWLRVPKPFEPGMLAGSMVEKFLESIDEEDPRALDESSRDIILQSMSSFVPMPTVFVPFLENIGNTSTLSGRPIIPRSLEDVDASLQRTKATSEVSIAMANWINGDDVSAEGKISPIQIDNVMSGWAGGLGMTFWRDAGNIIVRGVRDLRGESSAMGPAPERDFLQMAPGLRGLVSTFPFGSRSIEEMYDLAERSRIASRTAQTLLASGRTDDYVSWVEEHGKLIFTDPVNREHLEQVGALRDQRQLVESSQMSPEDKRKSIHQIDLAMMQIASELVQVMKGVGIRPQGPRGIIGTAISLFSPGG